MAVRNALPFEFLYRWGDVRRFFGKLDDEAVDYLDQRDRDLEDYLAGLRSRGDRTGMGIEHVSVKATSAQTITAAGGNVQWGSILGAPVEQEGVASLTTADLPTTTLPVDIPNGRRILTVHLIFTAETAGTVQVVRTRNGTPAVLSEEAGSGTEYYTTVHLDVTARDTVAVRVVPDAETTISWGRVQVSDFEDGDPATEQLLLLVAYNGAAVGSGPYKIGVGWSRDGVTWEASAANPVISTGTSGSWDDAQVKDPSVVQVGDTLHMLYAGFDGSNWRLGHATSPATDGETWTKQGQVLNLGASGAFDETGLVFPTIHYDATDTGAEFKVWYGGQDGAGVQRIGYAYGSTLGSLTKHGQVLGLGTAGEFDDEGVLPGAVVKVGSTWHLLYAGLPNASGDLRGWQPGLATFASPTGTYTKDASNPAFARRTSAYQTLTTTATEGDTTLTVADSSVFEVGEPVVIDSASDSWAAPYVVSIDSATQITVSFGPAGGDLSTADDSYVASLFYGSLFPRSVRELDDGTWRIYGTAFQFAGSELAELSVAWTAPTLDGVWTPDYTQNFSNPGAQGWMLPTGDTTSWSGRSAENPSVVEVST